MRRAARTDSNHKELLGLAKRLGGFVIDCRSLGGGYPDAFVHSTRGGWIAVEIKTARGTFTRQQKLLHALVPVTVWRSESDVLTAFGIVA